MAESTLFGGKDRPSTGTRLPRFFTMCSFALVGKGTSSFISRLWPHVKRSKFKAMPYCGSGWTLSRKRRTEKRT